MRQPAKPRCCNDRISLGVWLCTWGHCAQVIMSAGVSGSLLMAPVSAQIVPDQTLGTEGSTVIPNTLVDGGPADQIEGGAIRGSALFHSFADFNVLSGQRVYFANPLDINQIFSRVTGSNGSTIFGTLGVNGGADLYFLNPNGVVFGPDARIDVRGTFLVSTADSFLFPGELQFSARTPSAAPLLTMAVSPGLQYGSQTPGSIVNGAMLTVGRDLTLSGGTVTSTGALLAPDGQLLVESVTGDVVIQQLAAQSVLLSAANDVLLTESQFWTTGDLRLLAGNAVIVRDTPEQPVQFYVGEDLLIDSVGAIDIFALNHPESGLVAGGDMVLRSPYAIEGDAHYWTGGDFRIETAEGHLGQLVSPDDPVIRATGDVEFFGYEGTSLHILAGGSVTANTIVITGPETGVIDSDYLVTEPSGLSLELPGNPTTPAIDGSERPTLDIRAGVVASEIGLPVGPVLSGTTTGFDGPFSTPPGTADDFFNTVIGLILSAPPPGISPATSANINIGDVLIDAPDGLVVLTTAYQPDLSLPGGDITLAQTLGAPLVAIGSQPSLGGIGLNAAGFGGDGSDVFIAARQDINIDNRNILTSSDVADAGDITLLAGGDINLDTGLLAATGERGGDIEIISSAGDIVLSDSIVSSYTTGSGTPGTLVFEANSIFLDSATAVVNATEGNTPGGSISLQATEQLQITDTGTARSLALGGLPLPPGTGIITSTVTGPESSGDVFINAGQVRIFNQAPEMSNNRAGITTAVENSGDAGNVEIIADAIELNGRNAEIATSALNGVAGDVTLTTQGNIDFLSGSFIEAAGLSGGDINFMSEAGNIAIRDSLIGTFTAGAGSAGEASFEANSIFLEDAAGVINVTEGLVAGGAIRFQATELLQISDSGTERTISFEAPEFELPDGTGITANTISGPEKGGDIVIDVGQLRIQNSSPIASDNRAGITTISRSGTTGDAGNIDIEADLIEFVGNNAAPFALNDAGIGIPDIVGIPTGITSATTGAGKAGAITVNTERLIIQNNAGLTSGNSSSTGEGDGNDIEINASESIELRGLAVIGSGTLGSGESGDVIIEVPTGRITLQDGALIGADTNSVGNAGRIVLNADDISISSGSRIGAATSNSGNAGRLEILNASRLVVDGVSNDGSVPSRLFFSSIGVGESTGDAGELNISAQELIVQNGGEITGDTEGAGSGGFLSLTAETLEVRDPNSRISFESRGAGDARGIEITTSRLVVGNQGNISVSGEGTGVSGDLNVTADSIFLNQQGRLRSETRASQGGNIHLDISGNIVMRNDGNPTEATEISARAFGTAAGGNIVFDVDGFILGVLLENSDVLAAAELGQGGAITGEAQGIFGFREFQGEITPESDFTATATSGLDGTVDVQTVEPPEQEPLTEDLAENAIAQGCIPTAVQGSFLSSQSSFRIIGRGGLPSQPMAALTAANWVVGLVEWVEEPKIPPKEALVMEPDQVSRIASLLAVNCTRR